ncbi:methyltransferase domain-containing protein [Candidatus Bathyarchaeota archaeon]|nr:methyltransferase domain-containing protein [Candidatus Bathyarchaeota archaeon]
MGEEEKEVRKLIDNAERHIMADDLDKAGEKLHQAIQIAKDIGNEELLNQILGFTQKFTYSTEIQSIELGRIETDGFILDIGGGGEGIIGKLNGRQVIAIDTSERELQGTQNDALKVVMDATDLKFLPESFDVCTAFFSFMYVPKNKRLKVFEEAHRVLRNNGKLLIWDVKIPEKFGDYKAFMVRLKVRLPNEETEAGYGVKWQTQNIAYFRDLAQKTKFKVVSEWSKGEIFYLEMWKEA